MKTYQITPSDLLFFRDGRPMETGEGSGGHGGNWPFPTVFFDALHAALWRAFPNEVNWEPKRHTAKKNRQGEAPQRFGNLKTCGPFPQVKDQWYFPRPLDACFDRNQTIQAMRPLTEKTGVSDLPAPLRYPLSNPCPPTKERPNAWWSKRAIESFLRGSSVEPNSILAAKNLFGNEWTTGIGTNPATEAQDGERIYTAEYLRLCPDVHLGCACIMPSNDGTNGDALDHLFPDNKAIICGGQQRACNVENSGLPPHSYLLPQSAPVEGSRVKWMLLSPAIFEANGKGHQGGWLPSWVDHESGVVLLPREKPERQVGETRRQWRSRFDTQPLDVKLVAACVGKPQTVTGWSSYLPQTNPDDPINGKRTRLAVPAGSVYFFEGTDAPLLAKLLCWDARGSHDISPRSGVMGEKGLGLGVTGPWEAF